MLLCNIHFLIPIKEYKERFQWGSSMCVHLTSSQSINYQLEQKTKFTHCNIRSGLWGHRIFCIRVSDTDVASENRALSSHIACNCNVWRQKKENIEIAAGKRIPLFALMEGPEMKVVRIDPDLFPFVFIWTAKRPLQETRPFIHQKANKFHKDTIPL